MQAPSVIAANESVTALAGGSGRTQPREAPSGTGGWTGAGAGARLASSGPASTASAALAGLHAVEGGGDDSEGSEFCDMPFSSREVEADQEEEEQDEVDDEEVEVEEESDSGDFNGDYLEDRDDVSGFQGCGTNDDDDEHHAARARLRKEIIAVQADTSLSATEKSKRIQALMMSKWHASHPPQPSTASCDGDAHCTEPTDDDRRPTYHHLESNTLGCKHYQRAAKLQANCCGRWYTCRFCHDQENDHAIVRNQTKNMLCMYCGTAQPAAQYCVDGRCRKRVARYYCNECKLWDDDPRKNIYHCPECKICRIGKGLGEDFFHCRKCNVCMALGLQGKHKCIERNLESDCPICGEYMFTSTTTVIFMPCGHCIHYQCHEDYIRTSYVCPTCFKSMADMSSFFERIDAVLAQQKMPPEYEGHISEILCNDCERRSRANFNFVYHKCACCGSYNTKVLRTLKPDDVKQGAEAENGGEIAGFPSPTATSADRRQNWTGVEGDAVSDEDTTSAWEDTLDLPPANRDLSGSSSSSFSGSASARAPPSLL